MKRKAQWGIYLVTDQALSRGRPVEYIVDAALRGGASMIQLREKSMPTRELINLAKRVKALTEDANVPLIINDRVDIALAVEADGVHVGQNDMDCAQVRTLLGPDRWIGLSVESLEHAQTAESLDVDYLGVSPIYLTPTKSDLRTEVGISGLKRIRASSRHPLVAIGGMNATTLTKVVRAGADAIAVVSAICGADDPAAATHHLVTLFNEAKQKHTS